MNLDEYLAPPIACGDVFRDPSVLPDWAWLYTQEHGKVVFSSPCRMTITDSALLSDEEADIREATLRDEGYRCVLCRAQIEDIIANLRARHSTPTQAQLEEAFQYYLDHDAFIVA